MRKPFFHETGRIRIRGGKGVDLLFREVLTIPGKTKS